MSEDASVLALDSSVRIADIAALKDKLDALDGSIAIDVSAVDSIDAAALQLLIAFGRHSAETDRKLSVQGDSEAFSRAVAVSGCESLLPLAQAGDAA